MSDGSLNTVLRYLRRLKAGPGGPADAGDGPLLQRYAAGGDPEAFAALVRRHGPMVWGVCNRMLNHPQDAEDAFQATFLVLVRRARSLRDPDRLAPFLYGVAYRVALKARTAAARRRAHEGVIMDQPAAATPDPVWQDLRPVLDEEVNRLPEQYRAPVLLCYLEGHTNDEAARLLGCPKGTVCSRLSRAREILRRRLARRGLGLSGAALATCLSENAAPGAVPPALLETTIRLAPSVLAGAAATGSTHAAALAEGVLHSMLMSKIKLTVVVLLALGIVGSGAGFLSRRPAGNKVEAAAPTQPAARKDRKEQAPPAGEDAAPSQAVEMARALTRPIKFGGLDGNTKLVEVFDLLAKTNNLTFLVNEKAFKAAGVDNVQESVVADPPVPPMHVALSTVLKKVLSRIQVPDDSATYLIRKDHIEITTEAAVRAELGRPETEPIPTPLSPLVCEEFKEVSLDRALRDIANQSPYNIVLDPSAADKAKTQITARLFNVPVDTAVRVLADMEGLVSLRLDNVFYVTTPEKAARLRAEQMRRVMEAGMGGPLPDDKAGPPKGTPKKTEKPRQ